MGTMIKILGMLHGYDIEIVTDDVAEDFDVNAWVLGLNAKGLSPRPRYQQRDNTPFEPFAGIVEKIEETKTKNDKPMFIAHVRPHVADGETAKELVSVKYMPPKGTWRVGDKVKVTKNDKGWLELGEFEGEVIPF